MESHKLGERRGGRWRWFWWLLRAPLLLIPIPFFLSGGSGVWVGVVILLIFFLLFTLGISGPGVALPGRRWYQR